MTRKICRGEIYKFKFPYTFDRRYPNGKIKYGLVLQSGDYFSDYSTTVILLLTSNNECEGLDHVVTIEKGTTDLPEASYVDCSQPYTILKRLLFHERVKYYGRLVDEKMDEIDEALYLGLCMDQQNIEE